MQKYGYSPGVLNFNAYVASGAADSLSIIDVSDNSMGYSFNMEEGLAGVGMMVLNLLNATPGSFENNYQEIYSTSIANTVMANFSISEDNELTPYIPYLVGISTISLLIIVYVILKKKKFFDSKI